MGRGHDGSFAIVLGQHILPLTSNGEISNHTPALTPTTHGKQSQRVTRGQKHQHSLAFIIHCPRYPCPAPGALRLPCPSIADGRPIHRPVASRGDDALTAAGPCDATAEISSQAASAVLRLPWIPASASRGAPDDPCPAGGPTFGTHHLRCIMNLPSRRAAGLSQGGVPRPSGLPSARLRRRHHAPSAMPDAAGSRSERAAGRMCGSGRVSLAKEGNH